MRRAPACVIAADGDRIHRYVAHSLPADDLEAFEIHLLECAECQQAVREGAAVRLALRMSPASRPEGRRAHPLLWWIAPVAAAAGILLWVFTRHDGVLARLGRLPQAPAFAAAAVRGDSMGSMADSGMDAYAHGRYQAAAQLLAGVPEEERTAGLRFYLGVATLVAGDPSEAVARLAEVPPGSPYTAEAQFYLGKAWLQLGNADSALAHLSLVPQGSPILAWAEALADSVRGAVR
jgi:hypothetical protein